jgi:hypothetical protein
MIVRVGYVGDCRQYEGARARDGVKNEGEGFHAAASQAICTLVERPYLSHETPLNAYVRFNNISLQDRAAAGPSVLAVETASSAPKPFRRVWRPVEVRRRTCDASSAGRMMLPATKQPRGLKRRPCARTHTARRRSRRNKRLARTSLHAHRCGGLSAPPYTPPIAVAAHTQQHSSTTPPRATADVQQQQQQPGRQQAPRAAACSGKRPHHHRIERQLAGLL